MVKFPSKLPPCIFINQQSNQLFKNAFDSTNNNHHSWHNLIFPFETDCVNLILMAPGLQSVLYWLEDIIDIFQADIWNVINISTARWKNDSHIPAVQGFSSIQIALFRDRHVHSSKIILQTDRFSTSDRLSKQKPSQLSSLLMKCLYQSTLSLNILMRGWHWFLDES